MLFRKNRNLLLVLTATLIASIVLATFVGSEPISIQKVFSDPSSLDRLILISIRFPRVVMACIAGGSLAVVGATYQCILKNSLADPYVLGVSGGAALGATIAIALGVNAFAIWGLSLVPITAFFAGFAATLFIHSFGRHADGSNHTLLAGVVFNAIASALITFVKAWMPPSEGQHLMRWLVGFVDSPAPSTLISVTIYTSLAVTVLLLGAPKLNLLLLGDDSAASLGVDVRQFEKRCFFASSAIVGLIVSLTGLVGFIGLIAPHATRKLVGPDHRQLMPACLLSGAIVLVWCDFATRILFRWIHTELPVGAVTALIGGPSFLWLLQKKRTMG